MRLIVAVIILLLMASCSTKSGVDSMRIISSDFSNEQFIPSKFTCDGEDVPPHIAFEDVPEGTKSLALIMDDPDAPSTFVHWVVWNIPPSQNIDEGVQGITDYGRIGYGGPCPPSGVHRYFFKAYALSEKLDLEEGSDKEELLAAMENYILAKAELMGKYQKQ